jgi:hypothetical protein
MAAYKRIKEFAAKQYEFMPKVLTPAIFDKAFQQAPLLISSFANDSNALKPVAGQNAVISQSRYGTKTRVGQESKLEDYDSNFCATAIEVQGKY